MFIPLLRMHVDVSNKDSTSMACNMKEKIHFSQQSATTTVKKTPEKQQIRGDRLKRGWERGKKCENLFLHIKDLRGPERNTDAERSCVC